MANKGVTGAKLGCVANKGLREIWGGGRRLYVGVFLCAPRQARRNGLSEPEVKRSRAEGAELAKRAATGFGERRAGLEGEFWVRRAERGGMGGLSGRRSEGASGKHEVL